MKLVDAHDKDLGNLEIESTLDPKILKSCLAQPTITTVSLKIFLRIFGLCQIFLKMAIPGWSEPCQKAFRELKIRCLCHMCSTPRIFISFLRCIQRQRTLSLTGVDARLTSIAYRSKIFNGCQKRWPTHEKKIFAIVHCLPTQQHNMGLHNTKVYTYNIFWKYLRHKRK